MISNKTAALLVFLYIPIWYTYIVRTVAVVSTVTTPRTFRLEVNREAIVANVDSKFLSFTIDSHQFAKHRNSINFSERLINLVKFLAPAQLRIGGTDSDLIEFTFNDTEVGQNVSDEHLPDTEDNDETSLLNHPMIILVSGQQFLLVTEFLKKANVDFIFGLNVLRRTTNGNWNSSNAQDLMDFLSLHNVKVFGWELGNEPDSFQHVFNVTLKSPKLAHDFGMLKNLTRKFKRYNKSFLIGPDVTRSKGKKSRSSRYLKGFLRHVDRQSIDMISFHQYYFEGKTATVDDFLNVTIMKDLETEIDRVKRAVDKLMPGKPIIIGETSSGWGGGSPISNTFASSFLWLDKLGQSALYGINKVFRQTLIGGHYGLIDLDEFPTPDYFISVLYKKLIGQRVLALSLHGKGQLCPPGLRFYAHCVLSNIQNGSVAIFGINVETEGFILKLKGMEGKLIQEYILQASNLTSRWVSLNGQVLKIKVNGRLPPFKPVIRKHEFYFPQRSLGFWVLPFANNKLCH